MNAQNMSGNTILHYTIAYGFTELTAYYISKGAKDTILNADGYTCYEGTYMHTYIYTFACVQTICIDACIYINAYISCICSYLFIQINIFISYLYIGISKKKNNSEVREFEGSP